jgi:hypothetical protein
MGALVLTKTREAADDERSFRFGFGINFGGGNDCAVVGRFSTGLRREERPRRRELLVLRVVSAKGVEALGPFRSGGNGWSCAGVSCFAVWSGRTSTVLTVALRLEKRPI